MKQVRKAIIPAVGPGAIDKPVLRSIVEKAVKSGIEDIIIVTDQGKQTTEAHFDMAAELEQTRLQKEKYELLHAVRRSSAVDIHYVYQKESRGVAHAIWCARNFIGEEPFAVLFGEKIVQAGVSHLTGRYIFTPDIFPVLEELQLAAEGEIQWNKAGKLLAARGERG